jgi:hypothetical protein
MRKRKEIEIKIQKFFWSVSIFEDCKNNNKKTDNNWNL